MKQRAKMLPGFGEPFVWREAKSLENHGVKNSLAMV